MRIQGVRQKVVSAVMTGYCNTSRDVADETGMPVSRCSKCISQLVSDGILRRTGRWMMDGNIKLHVFEVIP